MSIQIYPIKATTDTATTEIQELHGVESIILWGRGLYSFDKNKWYQVDTIPQLLTPIGGKIYLGQDNLAKAHKLYAVPVANACRAIGSPMKNFLSTDQEFGA